MKKIKYILFSVLSFFILMLGCNAKEDDINRIDIDIKLDKNGNAHIEEVWQVKANMGTEFYKVMENLGNMELSNFKVYENDRLFIYEENWNLNASLSEKKYKNGINYTSNGMELCFGKGSYGNHTFKVTYDLSNFVFLTDDKQVIYYKMLDLDNMPDNFTLKVTGPSSFSDSLPVWGYGYKGYAYVKDGIIEMSNEENTPLSNSDYVVLLVEFDKEYFNVSSDNTYGQFTNFDDVKNMAEENTFNYDYDNSKKSIIHTILSILCVIFWPIIFIILGIYIATHGKYRYETKNGKIKVKEVRNFRDIPCNKDIFKGYFIAIAYKLGIKQTDFFGALLLKWLFEDKIKVEKREIQKVFKTKTIDVIILHDNLTFDNNCEKKFYDILVEASKDYVLEPDELEKWSKNNYSKLFNMTESFEKCGRDKYINESKVEDKNGYYILKDTLKEEAERVYGLKKYLKEFTRIKEKSAITVKLWKEYLMFAQIFGIANKVASEFKRLYPEEIMQYDKDYDFDFNTIYVLNNISHNMVQQATSARSAAESYSSGGGGFSSGGGGGGSFGGGGGGGR